MSDICHSLKYLEGTKLENEGWMEMERSPRDIVWKGICNSAPHPKRESKWKTRPTYIKCNRCLGPMVLWNYHCILGVTFCTALKICLCAFEESYLEMTQWLILKYTHTISRYGILAYVCSSFAWKMYEAFCCSNYNKMLWLHSAGRLHFIAVFNLSLSLCSRWIMLSRSGTKRNIIHTAHAEEKISRIYLA